VTDQLKTIADLDAMGMEQAEAIALANSPKTELLAWIKTLNDPEVDLHHQSVQITRAKRAAAREPKLRETFRIEPSSIKDCSRKLWYQLMGAEKKSKFDARILQIFGTGHAIHEQYQCYCEAMWGWSPDGWEPGFHDEMGVMIEDLWISGSTDGIRSTPLIRYQFDIKTINHDRFTKLNGRPEDGHAQQLLCYMKAFDIPFGYILYINKDKSLMEEVLVMFSHVLWESIERKCQAVIESGPDGADRDVKKWACRRCDYSHVCTQKGGR